MPAGFWFPNPTVRAWVAEPMNEEDGSGNYAFVGRRAPGTDGPALTLALQRIASRLGERFQYPAQWDKTKNATLTPVRDPEILEHLRDVVLNSYLQDTERAMVLDSMGRYERPVGAGRGLRRAV